MKRPAIVRIKGAPWQAMANTSPGDDRLTGPAGPTLSAARRQARTIDSAHAMLLDLALRQLRGLRLSATESGRLAGGLRRCLQLGEAVDLGPIGNAGRLCSVRRHAKAVAIRVGEGYMRVPLTAAKALVFALKNMVKPKVLAKTF